jgi:GT2 family glycosyltransferase
MKLSVILPCFNGAETVALQLEALTRQHWAGGWEVVVVNNGSTDRSMEIVESYRGRLPELRIVDAHQPPAPRKGVTHSYTVGFAAARGDAFVLCEADDEVGDGWLEELARALEAHPFVAAALEYSRLNPAWMVGGWQQQTSETGLSTISGPLYLPYASGCSLGLRRSVYEAVGNPDEAVGASWDTDYCWRAHRAGIPLHFVPTAKLHYRLRTENRDAYRQGKSWGKAHVVLEQKWKPAARRWPIFKHQVRALLALARHARTAFGAFNDRGRARAFYWGLGWCIGEIEGVREQWQKVGAPTRLLRSTADEGSLRPN